MAVVDRQLRRPRCTRVLPSTHAARREPHERTPARLRSSSAAPASLRRQPAVRLGPRGVAEPDTPGGASACATRSGELRRAAARVAESLPHAGAGSPRELLGLEEQPVRVARVLAAPVLEDRGEHLGVVGLVLVDEHLEDRRRGEELGEHDALGRLVGALLVDRCAAGHPERDDDVARLALDEHLGGDREVLEAGTVRETTSNSVPCPGHPSSSARAAAPMS